MESSMALFLSGLLIGLFWQDIKWLTYDLLKAVFRGVHSACKVAFTGELKAGYTRRSVLRYLPNLMRREVVSYVKWEWLRGCELGK